MGYGAVVRFGYVEKSILSQSYSLAIPNFNFVLTKLHIFFFSHFFSLGMRLAPLFYDHRLEDKSSWSKKISGIVIRVKVFTRLKPEWIFCFGWKKQRKLPHGGRSSWVIKGIGEKIKENQKVPGSPPSGLGNLFLRKLPLWRESWQPWILVDNGPRHSSLNSIMPLRL